MKWNFESLQIEALKYRTRGEFQKIGSAPYQAAKKANILDQVCSHMENAYIYWSNEKLANEAGKHQTRGAFKKSTPSGYYTARKRKILNQICNHMEDPKTEAYTNEELQDESNKYFKRTEFQNKSKGAYLAAYRRGVLERICSHMDLSINISTLEKCLFDTIKAIYPTTKRLKDTRVAIKEKSHIKGFDLDILVPELNKAIEFDGKYWHSFEGLKRSRKHWPEEDIRNYHELKDCWFVSKGIKILHIKEEDWLKNKQDCIEKCLQFLGVK